MKKLLKITLAGALAVVAMASCSHEEAYNTHVIRDFTMTLDGEPWNIYYNTKNMPLFIYYEDGSFLQIIRQATDSRSMKVFTASSQPTSRTTSLLPLILTIR